MKSKTGQYFVGKISDFAKTKGWFFGSFMDSELLQSEAVEIAWQQISNTAPNPNQKHLHRKSVEINILIRGTMKITINGESQVLEKGDFYVVWPETVVEDIATGPDTELIVVRAPSLPEDKYSVS
jgi:quercetin dioxygenase-like cupin family protein